jgi:hypothetical protein
LRRREMKGSCGDGNHVMNEKKRKGSVVWQERREMEEH